MSPTERAAQLLTIAADYFEENWSEIELAYDGTTVDGMGASYDFRNAAETLHIGPAKPWVVLKKGLNK